MYTYIDFQSQFQLERKKMTDRNQTWATHSIAGEIKRQGPHQLATNSTRTGRSDFKTVSENWLSFISVIPPQVIENLPTAVEELRDLHGALL
jgi:hypothetical protein